ncbi:hypothetical protein Dda_9162 [Drechslerella dactyloides]|uniref:Uncharacterized protein n=1 Tax=Drechslerella dactyloides TaxID=74499 RepID=A0AAD6IPM8_DREDA|nr:hypothetical protein Dda_9162 [Drechslerella dactyloides]
MRTGQPATGKYAEGKGEESHSQSNIYLRFRTTKKDMAYLEGSARVRNTNYLALLGLASFYSAGAQNTDNLGLGTTDLEPFLRPVKLPSIIAEWSALLPLTCYLADRSQNHKLVGEISVSGRLSPSLFPRLGIFDSIFRLLSEGSEFLDKASSLQDASVVFDVNWGSVFPCANGSVCSMVCAHALRSLEKTIKMPENVTKTSNSVSSPGTESIEQVKCEAPVEVGAEDQGYRRYQTLRVFKFDRHMVKENILVKLGRVTYSWYFIVGKTMVLLGVCVVLALFGSYGSMAVLFISSLSQVACHLLNFRRPATYLRNNESHDACMLVATHENSITWNLFVGDRGVVDSILNKPMIELPLSKTTTALGYWFSFAHFMQILAMTYVPAQKSWDGPCLLILMVFALLFELLYQEAHLMKSWLSREGITVKCKSFQFGSRYQMMGALQVYSGRGATAWMDGILARCDRRQAWLERIGAPDPLLPRDAYDRLGKPDKDWVDRMGPLTIAAARILEDEVPMVR